MPASKLTLKQILRKPSYCLVPGHLYTGTWKGRRKSHLERLEKTLIEWGLTNVSVVEFGPGGVAEKFAERLPEFDEEDLEMKKKYWNKILNLRETMERNRPFSLLTCFEPKEVYEIIGRQVGIRSLDVVDKYQKVIDGVNRLKLPNTNKTLMDLDAPVPQRVGQFDVAICFNFIEYCTNYPLQALESIYNSVRDGGFMAINLVSSSQLNGGPYSKIPNFTMIRPGVYMKGERPDKIGKSRPWRVPKIDLTEIERIALS